MAVLAAGAVVGSCAPALTAQRKSADFLSNLSACSLRLFYVFEIFLVLVFSWMIIIACGGSSKYQVSVPGVLEELPMLPSYQMYYIRRPSAHITFFFSDKTAVELDLGSVSARKLCSRYLKTGGFPVPAQPLS